MAIRKIKAGLVTNANVRKYIGEDGQLFYNPSSGELRISDAITPGGHPLNPYKRTLTIPSWPPAYIAPSVIYKVFDAEKNIVDTWETDSDGVPFKQTDTSIATQIDFSEIFVNSAGLPITPYQP
jgi:hypothetical protein